LVGRSADAVAQPGAQLGQQVHCPVSGVLFEVKETSAVVDLDGQSIYLCCPACAQYFTAHRDHVLKLRGIAIASRS
jgi:YHS domain-containing protein